MKIIKNKTNFGVIFFLAGLMLFGLGTRDVSAQTFPKSGATWIFKDNNPADMDILAQKWEYKGDSTSINGVVKKMKVTTKAVNPGWYPYDTTIVSEGFKYFLFVGDTIWDINDSLSPIANFSLQVGDSAYTPYHSSLSPLYPLILDSSNNCSQNVQSLFFRKGVVTETGIETENNINNRYYQLKFADELGDTIMRKFSERTILTQGYWHYNNTFLSSCSSTDFPNYSFLCYKDDFSSASTCNETDWFGNLNVKEEEPKAILSVFPNPANEIINLKTNNLNAFKLNVYDIIGKLRMSKDVPLNKNKKYSIDISELDSGSYILEVISKNDKLTTKFIKNKP